MTATARSTTRRSTPWATATISSSLDPARFRLLAYSTRPKKTSIYKLDRRARGGVAKGSPFGLGHGVRVDRGSGPGKFLIANYSSPVEGGGFDWAPDSAAIPDECKRTERWSWIRGQTSRACGTRIYLATVSFP